MPDDHRTSPLIQARDVERWLTSGDSAPIVVDVRWQLGRGVDGNQDEYLDGHIPGAGFLDLETALAGHPRADGVGGRHPLPDIAAATEALRSVGIATDRPVVFYDGATSLAAARAWWVLHYFGKHDVYVLDGGYAAWLAAGLPSSDGEVSADPGDVVLSPGGRVDLAADDVSAYLEGRVSTSSSRSSPGVLIDARAPERYRGDVEPMDPIAGHIPGAVNVPTLGLLLGAGTFDPTATRQHLKDLGVDDKTEVALYCGSGVQAAHLALAIEVAQPGRPAPAVYVGSWSDWVSDPSRPVATTG